MDCNIIIYMQFISHNKENYSCSIFANVNNLVELHKQSFCVVIIRVTIVIFKIVKKK